jgi:hypothetical protein
VYLFGCECFHGKFGACFNFVGGADCGRKTVIQELVLSLQLWNNTYQQIIKLE